MLKTYSKYKTDGGQVFPVLIAPRTLGLSFGSTTNSATNLDLTTEVTLKVRRDVSEFGITTRKVRLRWTGDVPEGYALGAFLYVVILTPELFTAIQQGQTGTYLGENVVVAKKVKERIR